MMRYETTLCVLFATCLLARPQESTTLNKGGHLTYSPPDIPSRGNATQSPDRLTPNPLEVHRAGNNTSLAYEYSPHEILRRGFDDLVAGKPDDCSSLQLSSIQIDAGSHTGPSEDLTAFRFLWMVADCSDRNGQFLGRVIIQNKGSAPQDFGPTTWTPKSELAAASYRNWRQHGFTLDEVGFDSLIDVNNRLRRVPGLSPSFIVDGPWSDIVIDKQSAIDNLDQRGAENTLGYSFTCPSSRSYAWVRMDLGKMCTRRIKPDRSFSPWDRRSCQTLPDTANRITASRSIEEIVA